MVCAWMLVLLCADIVLPANRRSSIWMLALAGLAISAALLAFYPATRPSYTFGSMWVVDQFGSYCKTLFLMIASAVVVMARQFQRNLRSDLGAFYMLLFSALLGMLVISSINDLLMLFLGLELVTFSLYIMASYIKTDPRCVESGMKYLIFGSVSSGFLVYGIALIYGYAGSTSFQVISERFASGDVALEAKAGLLLILAGLGFKVAMVPFHLWVPDVYEGAPSPVAAFLSVGSKMAGVVALLRILFGAFFPMHAMWAPLLAMLSAATMLYGNLAAIPQTNIKRLLGYSSIGHAGYLLMGLSTGSTSGIQAVLYYLLAYLFGNLSVFLVVVSVGEALGTDEIERYNGLSKRSPLLAGTMFIGLLSLAGVPPLVGFAGKLFILLSALESQRLWLVAIGAVNVAISLYYYLLVVKRMYMVAPLNTSHIPVSLTTKITLAILVAGILIVGVYQNPFLNIAIDIH